MPVNFQQALCKFVRWETSPVAGGTTEKCASRPMLFDQFDCELDTLKACETRSG